MGGVDAVLADAGSGPRRRGPARPCSRRPCPADVAAAVTDAYAALGDRVPVAVRSSATAEDLPGASFAGQQDTYLNVVGVDAVLDAVRRCWASLWTDRAVAYRADAGIPHAGTQLAVVVQRMVDAQVAGVLFTADPISGRRTRSVLDAAPGLRRRRRLRCGRPRPLAGRRARDHPGPGRGRLPRRRAGARPRRRWAAGSRRTSARRRTSSGPSTATGVLWLTQSRAITTLYPVPPSPTAGPARPPQRQRWPRA